MVVSQPPDVPATTIALQIQQHYGLHVAWNGDRLPVAIQTLDLNSKHAMSVPNVNIAAEQVQSTLTFGKLTAVASRYNEVWQRPCARIGQCVLTRRRLHNTKHDL